MSVLFRLVRDVVEFIRYPEVRYLIGHPDDPIPYELS